MYVGLMTRRAPLILDTVIERVLMRITQWQPGIVIELPISSHFGPAKIIVRRTTNLVIAKNLSRKIS